jgi:dynein heavy chain 1
VNDDERAFLDGVVDDVAAARFPSVDVAAALQRPILFSDWLGGGYSSVNEDELRVGSARALVTFICVLYTLRTQILQSLCNFTHIQSYVQQRLKVFNEEVLDVRIVAFDAVLEHVLRIDRVLAQPLGHLLLVGASGAGKTILTRFVAWLRGASVFQIKVHRRYTAASFDSDLRAVLTRAGVGGEQIAFIFDESNAVNSGFLERMNALLASGEVRLAAND